MSERSQAELILSETTIGALLHRAAVRLRAVAIEAPQREARLLLAAAADLPPATLLGWPERTLAADQIDVFGQFLNRRLGHEPLSRILGRRAFWTLDLAISPATLDPRPDTETIVEAALAHMDDPKQPLCILDLGTGTGAILLALLSELSFSWGLGIDRSFAALQIARRNAVLNGLNDRACFTAGDWTSALAGKFDLIVSNPPYINSAVIPALPPEVQDHDPYLALDGGRGGLDAYREIIPALPLLLKPNGVAVVEIGMGQAPAICDLFGQAALRVVEQRADIAGIMRAVTAIQP